MTTPFAICCERKTRVKDSRILKKNGAIYRRRMCVVCGKRFTTLELATEERDEKLDVVKFRADLVMFAMKWPAIAVSKESVLAEVASDLVKQEETKP